MLTFQEINDLCQSHKIDLTIGTARNFTPGAYWVFGVSVEYADGEALRLKIHKTGSDLSEAINSAFAELFKLSREGFKFPVMLEAPKADVDPF